MIRVGIGFDAHRFDAERSLVIGGVDIPDSPGLAGHSDADVLCHAIADALLGAARMGDLGDRFPNDDRWRDASSLEILGRTAGWLGQDGWTIVSVDATVIAEAPRLDRWRPQIAANVASALDVEADGVSVKATTTDGLGFTGRREGIAAIAVAAVHRDDPQRSGSRGVV